MATRSSSLSPIFSPAIHAGRRPPLRAEGHPCPAGPPPVAHPHALRPLPASPRVSFPPPLTARTFCGADDGRKPERTPAKPAHSPRPCDPLRNFSSGEAWMLQERPGPLLLGGYRLTLSAWQDWGSPGSIPSFWEGSRGRAGRESLDPAVPGKGVRRARLGLTLPRSNHGQDSQQSGSPPNTFRLPDLFPSIQRSGLPLHRKSAGNRKKRAAPPSGRARSRACF